jgi:hypothetical protein
MAKHTAGPWQVWSGPSYVGGGADLCIGAGETWLANMDHRNCINSERHVCGGDFEPCKREKNTDICSTVGCRCGDVCPEENHISEEQMANARLIASAPELLEALRSLMGTVKAMDELDSWIGERCGVPEAIINADAAIAKAEKGEWCSTR